MLVCAAAYLYVFPYQPGINNPNENARLYMTAAIAEQGTYVVDDYRARWGWTNDCAVKDGHAYSVKAPGTSLLGVPGYSLYYAWTEWRGQELDRTVALWVCRVTGTILPWLLFLFYFHRWLGRASGSGLLRDAVFFSVALGSCLYGYGLLFVSHTTSAAAAFGAFMLLSDAWHAGRARWGRAALAGLLTAAISWLEYPGFIASAILTLFALVALRPRRWIPFGVGALLPTLSVMHFQWRAFGNPLTPGHRYVETDAFREIHEQGFFGAKDFQWDALYGLLVHPGKGLLPLTPILAFALLGLAVLLWRRRTRLDALVALSICVVTTVVICFMINWNGGWVIGPRYLALLYPFLAWPALVGLERVGRRAAWLAGTLAVATTAVGLVLSAVPSIYYPHYPIPIDRPVSQIVWVLMTHDYAPHAAANLFGVWGTASLAPLGLLGLGTLALIAWQGRSGWTRWTSLLLGPPLAALIAWPLLLDPRPEHREIQDALALITRSWDPAGHDRAAVLEAALEEAPTAEGYAALAALYEAEGRTREAHLAEARARASE